MATVATTGPRAGWLHALRRGTFRRVRSATTVQQFGHWFSGIALQWLAAVATDHDPLVLSLLYFVMLLPLLLLSLPAGVLADVRDRRHVLLSTQLAVLLTSTTMAVPVYGALGTVSLIVLRRPVTDRIGRAVERREKARVRVGRAVERREKAREGAGPGRLAARREPPPAGIALATVAMTSVFAASYLAQTPVLADLVSDDPRAFPALTSAGGAGALIGVLTVALLRPAAPTVTPAAVLLVLLSGTVMGLGASRERWLSVLLIGAAGALQFGVMTHLNAVIQQVIENSHRGRVMSLYGLCWGGLLPVGGLLRPSAS